MARLLHIQASPRGDQSFSIRLAQAFLQRYAELHPDDIVDTLALFEEDLPLFDAPAAKAKYAVLNGERPAGKEAKVWAEVIAVADRFKAADKLMISAPMWNFSIPYRLKQYIDIIVQPAITFSYSPETGYTGLVTGRPAALLLARGGEYLAGTPSEGYDQQRPYLETILRFIGFADITAVTVQPTLSGAEAADRALMEALPRARVLAEKF